MEEVIDNARLSAMHKIMRYRDDLIIFNSKDASVEISAKIFTCDEILDQIVTFTKLSPLDIIEQYGIKMKAYTEANPDFADCVVACEVMCDILGG